MADLRTTYYNELEQAFREAIAVYGRQHPRALSWEIDPLYAGQPSPVLRSMVGTVYFHNYAILFNYIAYGLLNQTNSILELQVRFGNAESGLVYSIYDVLNLLDSPELPILTLPWITSRGICASAVAWLGQQVDRYTAQLQDIADHPEKCQIIETNLQRDVLAMAGWQGDPPESRQLQMMRGLHQDLLRERLIVLQADILVKNNLAKAGKRLAKMKNRTLYESRLLAHLTELNLRNQSNQPKQVCGPGREPAFDAPPGYAWHLQQAGKLKSNIQEFLAMFAAWILMTPAWGLLFWLLYGLFFKAATANSLHVATEGVYYLFMPAFICSIAFSYNIRHWIYRRIFRRSADLNLRLDAMSNGPGTDRFMQVFFRIVLIGSVGMVLFLAKSNIRFYEQGFMAQPAFLAMAGEYYPYQQVDHIAYQATRVNGFGDTLDSPSYVIYLRDGQQIDLFDYDSVENTKKHILPILRQADVAVVEG
jgi:hypothetical protein